jgi:very-short-patch-repair endonuclease
MNIKNKALGYEFHRQVPFDKYIDDFFCHELNLAIEVDGYAHDYIFVKDVLRQLKLESLGTKVVRFIDLDTKKIYE